jgi:hypothetical protein
MTAYISVLLPLKNRPSPLFKVKACGERTNQLTRKDIGNRSNLLLLEYHILSTSQAIALFPHFFMRIGLDKPVVRAKGINHPKYSVEAEYACLKRESARPLSNLH